MNRTTPPARRDPLIEALDALERAAAMQAQLLNRRLQTGATATTTEVTR